MNAKKLIREIGWKVALVMLLAILAFQSLGMKGLAANSTHLVWNGRADGKSISGDLQEAIRICGQCLS